ncbi:MAG: YceI family protein [Variovorax sp.]|nr:YceI family protein [Variovorax sp.]
MNKTTFVRMTRRAAGVGILLLAATTMLCAAADPALLQHGKSQIAFVTRQMGVPVQGTFKQFDAQVAFDPKKPEGGTIALQIDIGSASLGVPMSDAELPTPTWFDAATFPTARFQSSAIKGLGAGKFKVAGKLTIKGIGHDVTVPFAITQAAAGESVAVGSFAINRLDYKVGEGEWTDTSMIANPVQVNFTITLSGLGPL